MKFRINVRVVFSKLALIGGTRSVIAGSFNAGSTVHAYKSPVSSLCMFKS